VTGFLDHLYTQLVTTSNDSTIANLYTLQITRAHDKYSQSFFTSRFLVTKILQLLCLRRCPLANTPQLTHSESELLYDWRFTTNQFFLVPSPLRRFMTRDLFQLNPCCHSPYVTTSLTRRWGCPLWISLALSRLRFAHITCYWKFFLLYCILVQILCPSRICKADHAYFSYLMLQRQITHMNGRKLDHRQV
jgi:hypothetical protein